MINLSIQLSNFMSLFIFLSRKKRTSMWPPATVPRPCTTPRSGSGTSASASCCWPGPTRTWRTARDGPRCMWPCAGTPWLPSVPWASTLVELLVLRHVGFFMFFPKLEKELLGENTSFMGWNSAVRLLVGWKGWYQSSRRPLGTWTSMAGGFLPLRRGKERCPIYFAAFMGNLRVVRPLWRSKTVVFQAEMLDDAQLSNSRHEKWK